MQRRKFITGLGAAVAAAATASSFKKHHRAVTSSNTTAAPAPVVSENVATNEELNKLEEFFNKRRAEELTKKPDSYELPVTMPEEKKKVTARKVKMTDYDRVILTKTLYAEARGEPDEGIHAVAHVIFNRVNCDHPYFAKDDTVSKVCLQRKQFSCWLFKLKMALISTKSDEYKRIEGLMEEAHLRYESGDDASKDSLFYIVKTIKHPAWTKAMIRVMILGNHEFFKFKSTGV